MRKNWELKVKKLEKQAHLTYGMLIFEEWLKDNRHLEAEIQNDWAILEFVPQELHLQCVFRILEKARNQPSCLSSEQADSAS